MEEKQSKVKEFIDQNMDLFDEADQRADEDDLVADLYGVVLGLLMVISVYEEKFGLLEIAG